MVAKKVWIPSKGTYSVGQSNNPYDPTEGGLTFNDKTPASLSEPDVEKTDPQSHEDLLQDNRALQDFLNVASLANLAHVHKSDGEWKARGDPTEVAIQVLAHRFGWGRAGKTSGENPKWKQLAEFPFDSDVKKMSVIFKETSSGEDFAFTKGAVERIIYSCTHVIWEDRSGAVEFTEDMRNKTLENMEAIASLGLRCLALASRPYEGYMEGKDIDRAEVEEDLTFLGLIGLYDPPRPESAGAVQRCHEAGIAVHMLTGDHKGTAQAIAKQVGILPADMSMISRDVAAAMVMTASEFDKLTENQIDAMPVLPLVVARCAPSTKVRMIEALHRRGKYCAMTGDGVNDSPSLKQADVGIAMGQAGSDVAKDASDIILTDDNFASILNAVEEGRRIFDNIQRFVLHVLAQNIAQAFVLLIGLAFKDTRNISVFPLSPVEIVWIIMVTSGFPDMGLGFEAAESGIMQRPPVSIKQGIFSYEILLDMLVYGLWTAALCLGAFTVVVFGFGDGNLGSGCNNGYSADCALVFRARATTFACLVWFSLFLAWEMIDLRRSFFRMQPDSKRYFTQWMIDVWRNKFLFFSIIVGFILMFPIIYIPVINHDVFVHTGISWEWAIVFVNVLLFFTGIEAWKWAKRVFIRRQAGKNGADAESKGDVFSAYIKHSASE